MDSAPHRLWILRNCYALSGLGYFVSHHPRPPLSLWPGLLCYALSGLWKSPVVVFYRFLSNLTTFSTCMVWGNMSTGCTAEISYFSDSHFRSRACVAGLQLTYIIFSGSAFSNILHTSSCIPAR